MVRRTTEFGFPGPRDEVRPLIGMGGDKFVLLRRDLAAAH
jgi:hypothetical protein